MKRPIRIYPALFSVMGVLILGSGVLLGSCTKHLATGREDLPVVARQADAAPANSVNVGVLDIPDVSPYSQVVAISDNHGMGDNLKRLLTSTRLIDAAGKWSGGNTLVIVIGDLIDKGPQSLEVLDLWMQLTAQAPAQGGRIVTLLGNHEAEFLADPANKKAATLREELGEKGQSLASLTDPTQPRGRFLWQMPLAARVGGKWLFCHAGWPPAMQWKDFVAKAKTTLQKGDYGNDLLLAEDSILEKRAGSDGGKWWDNPADVTELEARLDHDGLYGVVFGHQPEAFGLTGDVGPYSASDHRLIKIDSGMSPEAGAHPGKVLIFPNPSELSHDGPPAHMTSAGP